jgi:hypothetical protein
MKQTTMAAAVAVALGWPFTAAAETGLEQRLERMERRVTELERMVQHQNDAIQSRDRQIHLLEGRVGEAAGGAVDWTQRVEVSGLVEVEASQADPFLGETTSDLVVATAELGVAARINDWAEAVVTLLYEEDETDLEVDVAAIGLAPPDSPWRLDAGQFYVPFGVFDTNMISDPLTLEIAETRETALRLGFEHNGFAASAYLFNGTNRRGGDDRLDNWGAELGYAVEGDDAGFAAGAGYINDIGDSDALQEALTTHRVADQVPGWTANGALEVGPFTAIGEYVAALDRFDRGGYRITDFALAPGETPPFTMDWTRVPAELAFDRRGAEPKAWNVELGYGFRVAGREAVAAIGYQGTGEAVALELPERRWLAALSVEVVEDTALSLEWAHDRDYDRRDGGTGKSADSLTAQVAVEF